MGCSSLCRAPAAVGSLLQSEEKIGICPVALGPSAACHAGSADTCRSDADCEGLKKCCSDGCARVCLYPDITTGAPLCVPSIASFATGNLEPGCLHRRAAALELATRNGALDGLAYLPQCDSSGDFVGIQCDAGGRRCWCLDAEGLEQIGELSL